MEIDSHSQVENDNREVTLRQDQNLFEQSGLSEISQSVVAEFIGLSPEMANICVSVIAKNLIQAEDLRQNPVINRKIARDIHRLLGKRGVEFPTSHARLVADKIESCMGAMPFLYQYIVGNIDGAYKYDGTLKNPQSYYVGEPTYSDWVFRKKREELRKTEIVGLTEIFGHKTKLSVRRKPEARDYDG